MSKVRCGVWALGLPFAASCSAASQVAVYRHVQPVDAGWSVDDDEIRGKVPKAPSPIDGFDLNTRLWFAAIPDPALAARVRTLNPGRPIAVHYTRYLAIWFPRGPSVRVVTKVEYR